MNQLTMGTGKTPVMTVTYGSDDDSRSRPNGFEDECILRVGSQIICQERRANECLE